MPKSHPRSSDLVRFVLAIAFVALSASRPALAQSREFVFTVTPAQPASPERWVAHYDSGYAERADQPFGYDGLDQRIGIQGSLGHGLTLLGQLGLGLGDATRSRTMGEVEVLKDLRSLSRGFGISAGLGLRREWEGDAVLLGRISAGQHFATSSLFGNVRFERPFNQERDALDLITTLGWLRRVGPAVGVGLEAVGQDLEGLWDKEEAEGGARIFVGPSIRIAPPARSWSASLCGGPVLYSTRTGRVSPAPRPLGASANGYTIRLAMNYSF